MTYFAPTGVMKGRITKMYASILMENCDHTVGPVLSTLLLHDPVCKTWIFENFIFELEGSYSFKINCIRVRQVISLKKNAFVISKFSCLISWSSICTPLILVSTSLRMASNSVTLIYNSMRVDTVGKILKLGSKNQIGDHLF